MKAKQLIRAIEKTGIKVEVNENHGEARGEKYVVSFYIQGESAICVNVRRYNDVSDMMTDYHAGFFSKTIKRTVEYISMKKAA